MPTCAFSAAVRRSTHSLSMHPRAIQLLVTMRPATDVTAFVSADLAVFVALWRMIAMMLPAAMPSCLLHRKAFRRGAEGRGRENSGRPQLAADASAGVEWPHVRLWEGPWCVEYWRAFRHRVSIRRRILDVACIVRHFRSCLEHDRCGGNHPRLEGGKLGIGHIAEPFGDRVGRQVEVERLRRATITAVQQLHRGTKTAVVGLAVLGKGDQRINRQARILAGLDHDVGNFPIDFTPRLLLQAALWRRRIFRQTRRIPALAPS
jgi:hypothetical protein